MEDQLMGLLGNTQLADEGVRKQAELELRQAQANPAFALSLANVAAHASVSIEIRQAALITLRKFIERNWSEDNEDDDDDSSPRIPIPDHIKDELRPKLLELAISDDSERKVKASVSYVVSKIANVDFPERWPALVPTLLSVMPTGSDNQLHGALKVLNDFVEENLSEDQFFTMARDIVGAVYQVALNEQRNGLLRSLAVSVFRTCFDLLDMVKDDHPKEVKGFVEEALGGWLPFFQQVLKAPLPEGVSANGQQPDVWRGPVALKLQVARTLIKIKMVFPSLLLPHSLAFFQIIWEELTRLQIPYASQYLENDTQGRLEDADGLPYTLDFLVLEELDFLNQCMRAAPVQKELGAQSTPWILDMIKLIVSFARIPHEEEQLWDIDVSLYLAEEGSITANYTARTACGDFLIKLGEWLAQPTLEGLYTNTKTIFSTDSNDWRSQEAALYLFTMLATDMQECNKEIPQPILQGYLELVNYAISRAEQPLLQARGYLVSGTIAKGFPPALALLDPTINAIRSDPSELVQVACIKALENYVRSGVVPGDRQLHILGAIESFLNGKDLQDIEDADDLLVALTESLRAAISINRRVVLAPDIKSLDLLFLVAQHGAQNYQVTMLVNEVFEEIVQELAADSASYATLCTRVLPTLTGAMNYGEMAQNEPLITLAAELIAVLLESGVEPLPAGIVAQLLPKLNKILMESDEGEILRPAAEAVKYMVMHDHHQVFGWQDEQSKCFGLEVCLYIIDRLLGPGIEDNAASEVGGLAAELVEKAGQERLGPYLLKLLQAVATRLASASAAQFIQSLILVFARLSLAGAADVVQFLSGIEIGGQNGLQVVLSKWLENSTFFAGFDEIRQNVIALSKIYSLNDPRVAQTMVKGDLIIDQSSSKIVTRSRSKQTPDQYTMIPASLKILKVLIDELLFASGKQEAATAAAQAAKMAELDEDDGDEGWEDEPDVLDLGLGSTKNDLMSYFEGGGNRARDDETQAYLTDFFMRAARENIGGFTDWYTQLNEEEKGKLNELAAQ
ncbi:hypothetical protein MCOR25_002833 [Pyricularia grisea]|uniref:Importin N-terminal domain-containing protein n=1 Tax=Pyricularia grisea TaxID=148305 RepID=A0A6P8BAF7_PYRGI|nr:uncharacterized protein PgNI_03800 [Pyricularia grisea]KAI6376198.1 hypothetical protein MCOR25_002833 [Pyricularia grisea]TLD12798.1 hypothetical protein PgNI_03800 [Pyricularia grisea]